MRLVRQLKRKKGLLKSQEGFTLIEIIAVLVILSILAVVAVPKYFDLQTEAQRKAMQAAMAEAIGRVNSRFASALLAGSSYDNITYSAAELGTNLGDFTLAVSDDGTDITLLVTGRAGTAVASETIQRVIPIPGGI